MEKVRVDTWLWSIRIFKSRTLAIDACKSGKVKMGSNTLKPATNIKVNDVVRVKKDGFNLDFKVVRIIDKRVGAAIAQECYENLTPMEEMNKYKDWFVGKGPAEVRDRGAGRPTKRDRRVLEDFKGDFFLEWEEE
ncbi:MAG: RNA-binding S4 domain-containing protein [Saprospiraceae bacterium]|nr:RNA-binding S4 domain-containing protein [Saprospiraceae bacterium]